jgi:preprotein translocase SecE subunit
MNREQKRAAQKAGQVNADGSQTTVKDRRAPAKSLKAERTTPVEFIREVRAELKKVSWPTRPEVIRYSVIVFVALVASRCSCSASTTSSSGSSARSPTRPPTAPWAWPCPARSADAATRTIRLNDPPEPSDGDT